MQFVNNVSKAKLDQFRQRRGLIKFRVDIYEGDIVYFNVRGDKLIPESVPYYNQKGIVEISLGGVWFGGWDSAYCTDVVVVGNIYQS